MRTPGIVVLLGAPGSGKGTQGMRLAHDLGIPHVVSSDLLRARCERGSDTSAIEHGDLVPDTLVTGLVLERLSEADAARGAVLDGYPRDLSQAEALDSALAVEHARTLRAIYLDVPAAVLIKRLSERRTCPVCQASYPVGANEPGCADQCAACQVALVHRPDDDAEVVRHRIQVYVRETMPVVEHYLALGVLQRVDGERPVETIAAELKRTSEHAYR